MLDTFDLAIGLNIDYFLLKFSYYYYINKETIEVLDLLYFPYQSDGNPDQ